MIYQARPNGTQAVKPDVAYAATKVLKGVISQGTASAADIGRPEAGKTGTSQSNRDCWFVGYTPQLVTSVWVGFTPERTVMIGGTKGFGGTVAAPIWARFMKAALAGLPARDFAKAPDPSYDESKFTIPVSNETKSAEAAAKQAASDAAAKKAQQTQPNANSGIVKPKPKPKVPKSVPATTPSG
jgi:penicillin-binding protein 1A